MSKKSSRIDTNGVECETDARGNDSLFGNGSDWTTNPSNCVVQINDLSYDQLLIDSVETELADDRIAVKNDVSSNANTDGNGSKMISPQNTSDKHSYNEE